VQAGRTAQELGGAVRRPPAPPASALGFRSSSSRYGRVVQEWVHSQTLPISAAYGRLPVAEMPTGVMCTQAQLNYTGLIRGLISQDIPAIRARRCLFPFGFAWQPRLPALEWFHPRKGFPLQPPAKSLGVEPGYVGCRKVRLGSQLIDLGRAERIIPAFIKAAYCATSRIFPDPYSGRLPGV